MPLIAEPPPSLQSVSPGEPCLIDWNQSIELITNDISHEVKRFVRGVTPIIVQQPDDLVYLVQSGQATSWWGLYIPPAKIGGNYISPPRVSRTSQELMQFAVSWSYSLVMTVAEYTTLMAPSVPESPGDETLSPYKQALRWPANPTFEPMGDF